MHLIGAVMNDQTAILPALPPVGARLSGPGAGPGAGAGSGAGAAPVSFFNPSAVTAATTVASHMSAFDGAAPSSSSFSSSPKPSTPSESPVVDEKDRKEEKECEETAGAREKRRAHERRAEAQYCLDLLKAFGGE